MAIKVQVVLDCADPARLAAFWAEALGYQVQPPPAGYESWPAFLAANGVPEADWNSASAVIDPAGEGPRLFLQRVPEPRVAKNRMHLDLNVGGGSAAPAEERAARVAVAVARLVDLGATEPREMTKLGESWVVMHDPEGNEFCVQ